MPTPLSRSFSPRRPRIPRARLACITHAISAGDDVRSAATAARRRAGSCKQAKNCMQTVKLFSDLVCTRNRKKIEMFTFRAETGAASGRGSQTIGRKTSRTRHRCLEWHPRFCCPCRRRRRRDGGKNPIYRSRYISLLARSLRRARFLLCHSCHQLCKRSAEASADFECMHVI